MPKSPNILIILADDIGWFDVGAYHQGMMEVPLPTSTASPQKAP